MASATQTNTVIGRLAITAGADFTAKEGYLVKLAPGTGGKPTVILPTDVADDALFIVIDVPQTTYVSGDQVYLDPLDPNRNMRAIAAGTITAGDRLVLSATWGKVATRTGAGADTYFSPGVAEEDATAGGWVRFRPAPKEIVVT